MSGAFALRSEGSVANAAAQAFLAPPSPRKYGVTFGDTSVDTFDVSTDMLSIDKRPRRKTPMRKRTSIAQHEVDARRSAERLQDELGTAMGIPLCAIKKIWCPTELLTIRVQAIT